MKKTLMTSLFCAAITLSSLVGIRNGRQLDAIKTNVENAVLPKQQKQNKYILNDDLLGQGFGKGDSLISPSINLGNIISNPDIGGPVFNPNPGSGGSSSLPTYREKDSSYEHDDYACTAKIIGDRGIIKGRINYHDDTSYTACFGIDKDYFRFSIHEDRVYTFNLKSAPNPNYYYEIYRFASDYEDTRYGYGAHKLIYSSRYTNKQRTMTLRPATYFICITSATINSLKPDIDYEFRFDYSLPSDYYSDVTLNSSILNGYDVITWESEYAPFNFNHFKGEPTELCAFKDTGTPNTYLSYYDGFVDPIFNKYENSWAAPAHSIVLDEEYKLDSITYLLNQSSIGEFAEALNVIRNAISDQANQQMLESLEVHIDWVDVGLGVIGILLTVAGIIFTGGAAMPIAIASLTVGGLGVAKALSAALDFQGDTNHLVSMVDIAANLTMLYDRCCEITEGNLTDKIIAIPRYSYLFKERVYSDPRYPFGTDICKIATTGQLPKLRERDYYVFSKTGTIRTLQPMYNYKTRTYDYSKMFKGKIQLFWSYDDYYDHTVTDPCNVDITEGGLNSKCSYVIYKRGSEYYCNAINLSNSKVRVQYNSNGVSDWEGQNFNFYNKDAYSYYEVNSGGVKTLSLGSSQSVYIREDKSSYAFKLSLSNDETVYSDPIFFGTEYLKLSVVSSSWSWFVRTWKIRVRNLFNKAVTFYYNTKMCFTGDAQNWSGLRDWTNTGTTIQPYGYIDVDIKENGTADAIGISWVETESNTRYISYANQLNWSSNTLSYRTNAVGI